MLSPFAPNPRYPETPFVNSRKDNTRYMEMAKLPSAKKQQLWAAIKAKKPALAELLGDAFVTELKKAFNATPTLTEQDYKSLMEIDDVR